MKNKGMVLIETLVSITLFFIVVFPLLGFNQKLLHTNHKLNNIKCELKNFQILRKQLYKKDFSSYIGTHEYSYEDISQAEIFDGIFIPELKDKNLSVTIEVRPLYIYSALEKYRYLNITLVYKTRDKTFSSKFISAEFEVYK